MTWTPTSSPTRRAAAAPASVAAFTDPTSPRTIAVTSPASTFCQPTKTTLAAFTIASAASIMPMRPRVSIMPSASPTSRLSLLVSATGLPATIPHLGDASARGDPQRVEHAVAVHELHGIHEVRHRARVVRYDAHAIAGLERRAAVHAHRGVLPRQPLDRQRIVGAPRRLAVGGEDGAVAAGRRDAARLIARERLAAAVEDDAAGMLRDDRREHGERAVVERRRAERHLRAIEVHVVAGPQLGDAALPDAEAQRRRRADRDLLERDARPRRVLAQPRERLRLLLRDRAERLFGRRVVGVAGVAEEAAQPQAPHRGD